MERCHCLSPSPGRDRARRSSGGALRIIEIRITANDAAELSARLAALALLANAGLAPDAPDYAAVQAAVTRLAAAKGRDAVLAVFERFGVDHAARLDAAEWPRAVAALTQALEG